MRVGIIILILSVTLWAKNFAVVVGIDNYLDLETGKLKGAVNDAKAFERLFVRNGFAKEDVVVLLNKKATKHNIKKALMDIEQKIKRGRGDRFYYFHAGHGAKLSDVEEFSSYKKTAVLLPYDFVESDINSYIITQKDLLPIFKRIDNKVAFGMLLFDSCFSEYGFRSINGNREASRYQSRYHYIKPKVNIKKFHLKAEPKEYPYRNMVSFSASKFDEKSEEDKEAKRGKFSMALESCLKEQKESTTQSIKRCLSRRYTKQLFVFEPKNREVSHIFGLKKNPPIKSKVTLQTTIPTKELSAISKLVTLVTQKESDNDFELSKERDGYRLISFPDGELINLFRDMQSLKTYLSNYRLINLKGKRESDIDIKVNHTHQEGEDYDKVPTNSLLKMSITSSKQGKIALFSLDRDGGLYMIEPNATYRDFENGMSIEGETTSKIGIDFLKVMIFDKPNRLAQIEVNESTGRVKEFNSKGLAQIDVILDEIKSSNFYEATRKTVTYR